MSALRLYRQQCFNAGQQRTLKCQRRLSYTKGLSLEIPSPVLLPSAMSMFNARELGQRAVYNSEIVTINLGENLMKAFYCQPRKRMSVVAELVCEGIQCYTRPEWYTKPLRLGNLEPQWIRERKFPIWYAAR